LEPRPVKRTIWVAVWITAPLLLFLALVSGVRSKFKNQARVPAEGKGILAYTETIPLRTEANALSEIESKLYLPSDPQTGQRRPIGYLTSDEVGGVRINPDGSIWIIVIVKDENRWLEFYAPARYFRRVKNSGEAKFLEMVRLD